MAQEIRHLVRIANTDLKGEKQIVVAMNKIKGVSMMYANAVLSIAGIDKKKKTGLLIDSEVKAIEDIVVNPAKYHMPQWLYNRRKDPESGDDKHILTSDLLFAQDNDVKMMKKTKSYRGMRHQWGLPLRGQKTKSNFRRNKGKGLGVKRKKSKSSGK